VVKTAKPLLGVALTGADPESVLPAG